MSNLILWLAQAALDTSAPGLPTLGATKGDRVIVHFRNDLPESTTIHWHGIRVPNMADGTPSTQKEVAPGESFSYEFTADDAGTFWYHPHVRGDIQLERGLYNSDNEAQFMVERKVGTGEFAVLATLPLNSTEFHDAPLMVGVTYVYRVMAMGKEGGHEGKNEYSNEAALTLAAGTAAPAGGAAGNGTDGPSAGRAHRGGGTAGHM